MGSDNEILTKDDLLNMMNSYKSNVEFTQELLSSQKVLVDEQGKIINKLSDITSAQEKVGMHLEHLIKTLTEHNSSCQNNVGEASSAIKDVTKKIDETKIENIKDHGLLKNHLMVISGGLLAVIVALIVALEKIWSKSDIIDAVAKHVGAN
jgi:hypothetical protein